MSQLRIGAGSYSWSSIMFSGYQCANCGSLRTSAFQGDHFLSCIRCDECGYSEYRDSRDLDDDDEFALVEVGL